MSPRLGGLRAGQVRFPRVSGDEPQRGNDRRVLPRFPRVSGDEPTANPTFGARIAFSPRERG